MPFYRSHPIKVEAWEFNPGTRNNEALMTPEANIMNGQNGWVLWVEKSQAYCAIQAGDMVIREPDGTGFYPCTREDFDRRYYRMEGDD